MSDAETPARGDWSQALRRLVDGVWNHRHIVIGLDLDSVASACFVQRLYPEARVIALYDTEHLIMVDSSASLIDIESALWLDQDVLGGFLCLGQHLVTADCSAPLWNRNAASFNPNEFFGQRFEHSFRRNGAMPDCFGSGKASAATVSDLYKSQNKAKFPFSTLCMLLHVYDDKWSRNNYVDAVVRHADSVAATLHDFPRNSATWMALMFTEQSDNHDSAAAKPYTSSPQSQLSQILGETQHLFRPGWSAMGCECNHCRALDDATNSARSTCLCVECQTLCERRRSDGAAFVSHVQLMVRLERLMPHHFDSMSRMPAALDRFGHNASKNAGVNTASATDKRTEDLYAMYAQIVDGPLDSLIASPSSDLSSSVSLPSAKRARFADNCSVPQHAYVSRLDWRKLFSGHQGLTLRTFGASSRKLDSAFDSKRFLRELNAFYCDVSQHAFPTAAAAADHTGAQLFDHFVVHSIGKPRTTNISRKRGATDTMVFARSKLLPLNEFLKALNVFSYAIMEGGQFNSDGTQSGMLRYTPTSGALTSAEYLLAKFAKNNTTIEKQ